MKEYILDTFKIGMSEKEAEKYFSKEIKKMNITERKIYLKNERKYLKFFKILLKRNRKFIIKIREYFEYEISNLFKKEQKILKKEIIKIAKKCKLFVGLLQIMLKDSYKSPKGFKVIKKGDILESERRQGFQKDGKPIGKPTDKEVILIKE